MIDITLNTYGKIEKTRKSPQKARNILSAHQGGLSYLPSFGFNYAPFMNPNFDINMSNINSEMINTLYQNGITSFNSDTTLKDFVAEFQLKIEEKSS